MRFLRRGAGDKARRSTAPLTVFDTVRGAVEGIFGDLARLFRVFRRGWADEQGLEVSPRVAVVLGAQVLPGGRASRVLEARVRHAARLYAEGAVGLVVVTGGTGEHPPSEAEVMAGILGREGVPGGDVVLEDRALNTWESAWYVAEIARRRAIGAVRVVTDPLHCVRAVEAFGEAGLPAVAEPAYRSPMWRGRLDRRGQLVREIVAVVWYRAWHGVRARLRSPGR
ncbi:hypothetical protein GBA65_11835 [Rubrobacter marinus]|uniref:DUF218 domain-containing protein n=1 Tax=Rubrobacter marinus TaxID=2653852 RepID=A0A6G8PY84_9ACTN|nr:YdcF family protein [Rubrobacter marinus]QIN79097.1 hypothetical protein GBA65_11835 [Rubrobacter marinus]